MINASKKKKKNLKITNKRINSKQAHSHNQPRTHSVLQTESKSTINFGIQSWCWEVDGTEQQQKSNEAGKKYAKCKRKNKKVSRRKGEIKISQKRGMKMEKES